MYKFQKEIYSSFYSQVCLISSKFEIDNLELEIMPLEKTFINPEKFIESSESDESNEYNLEYQQDKNLGRFYYILKLPTE